MENTNCLAHICRKYQLSEKLRKNHTRWELPRFTQEAAISTPMFEFASDSFPEAANMRNLPLNLFYVYELGNKKSELCVCSSVSRVSKACNLARMIAPAERNWVPEAMVPAVRLDAAPTTGVASRWI